MKVNSLNIQAIQRKSHISGIELAARIGMNPRSLSALKKRGTTTELNARAIARALGVELSDIVQKEEVQA